ncbi:aldo/keto reductase [uncultured Phenylobacterium sp.]|uniref:aldo/keto reductase n=1 Tax=uncultured Phenylobacterium sp. TaxID=349273 RepID=UPI0025E9C91B|nr:aldo/keto reductase [uncultured Phenylobacterium sp.]
MRLNRREIVAAGAVALTGCSRQPAAAQLPTPAKGPMLTRPIPSSGEQIPVVGLGTWQAFDITSGGGDWTLAREALQAFADGGGKVVDSSPMYGRAEAAIGALAADLQLRPQLFLATKVWTRGREAGVRQMEDSRRLLQAPVIDLMQVHNLLDLEAHMPTLAAWKAEGRIRYVGATHYTESGYDALEAAMRRHRLDFIQINASAAEREAEARILPLARERGMAVLINRPFAGGDLFARLRRQPLPPWAAEIGAASWAQVLLKYVLADPAVTCAIPGTRNPRHVLDNLGAGSGALPDASMRRRILDAVAAA